MRAAIILAAGASRRFGRQDKLRQRLGGRTLLDHAVAHVRRADVQRIIVVGAKPKRRPGNMVLCRARRGAPLAASLAAGLRALRPVEREALIFLADMPFAYAPRLRLAPDIDAIRPGFGGKPGHPVLVRTRAAFHHLRHGDRGLAGMPGQRLVPGESAHVIDIDTPADLRRARRFRQRVRPDAQRRRWHRATPPELIAL